MLAAIFASCLSVLAHLVSLLLPLFAQLKDNCLGSPPPSPYHHHSGRCDVSTNRLGQLRYRLALWSLLRLRCLREGVHLAAHLSEHRERQSEEEGAAPVHWLGMCLKALRRGVTYLPYAGCLLLLLLFDH